MKVERGGYHPPPGGTSEQGKKVRARHLNQPKAGSERFRKAHRRYAPFSEARAASSKSPFEVANQAPPVNSRLGCIELGQKPAGFSLPRPMPPGLPSVGRAFQVRRAWPAPPPLLMRRRDEAHRRCQPSQFGALQVHKYESAPSCSAS